MKKEKNAVLAIFAALKIWPPEIVGEEEIFLGPQKGFLEFLPIFLERFFFYFFLKLWPLELCKKNYPLATKGNYIVPSGSRVLTWAPMEGIPQKQPNSSPCCARSLA